MMSDFCGLELIKKNSIVLTILFICFYFFNYWTSSFILSFDYTYGVISWFIDSFVLISCLMSGHLFKYRMLMCLA